MISERLRLRGPRLILAVLVLALLLVRAALPLALEWAIEWQGTQVLGRVVEIGDLDLALAPGGVALEALAVGPIFEGDEPPPLDPERVELRSDRIEARWSWLSLLRGELHLEGLEIAAPGLLALRAADGQLVPVLRPAAAPAAEEPAGEDDGEGWPLRLDRLRLTDLDLLYVDLAIPGLRPLELRVEEFALDDLLLRGNDVALGGMGLRGPRLRVRRDIDLSPFAAAPAAGEPEAAPGPSPTGAPPAYRVAEVSIERAGFGLLLDDREIEVLLSLRAREISGEPGARFPLELRLELEGGWLEIEAEVGASPPAFEGAFRWSELPLEPLSAAAGLALELRSGAASGDLEVSAVLGDAAAEGAVRVDVSGRLGVRDLDAAASDGSLALAWRLFELELDRLALRPDAGGSAPPALELAALRWQEPALRLTRRRAPVAEPAAAEPPASPEEPATAPGDGEAAGGEPAPRVRLALLELTGGQVELVDETLAPPHRSRIRDLAVRGRDLAWPERDAAELQVRARGPEEASLAVDASLRQGRGRVKLDLENLGLAGFSPYAAEAAGYWIEGGEASLRAEVGVAGEAYALESDLALDRLDVAEVKAGSFEKEFGVPLDLALALLRNPRGRIGIPIAAELEGGRSRVAVASVVAAALRQALVGALTAPLKGLGLLVGSGEGGSGLRLDPLSAAPGAPAPELEGLAPLAQALEARPGLGLGLRGRVGPEDEPALAERMLAERIAAGGELPPVEAGFLQKRRLRRALEERARGGAPDLDGDDAAALARWIGAMEVTEAERQGLARSRAEAARDALVARHGVAAERIEVRAPLEGPPGVVVELAPLGG